MVYQTNKKEAYRMLACAGHVDTSCYYKLRLSADPIIKQAVQYADASRDFTVPFDKRVLHYLIERQAYSLINKYFLFHLGLIASGQGSFSVLDPFAGDGSWLDIMCDLTKDALPVGITQDQTQFDALGCKHKYLGTLDDCEIPKKSINLLLFNPPKEQASGRSGARHYLTTVVDKQILSDSSAMVAVLTGEELLDICDILYEQFMISIAYRIDEPYYSQTRQFVVYFRKKQNTSGDTEQEAASFRQDLERMLYFAKPFDITCYRSSLGLERPVNYAERVLLFEKAKAYQVSQPDKVWNWALKSYDTRVNESFELLMPRSPKISEMANLLASGIINGYIDDPECPHIVSGGVKKISRREVVVEDSANGPVEKTRETKLSKPFLNILVKENGVLKVKQIEGTNQ